jgi:hypothetical protein
MEDADTIDLSGEDTVELRGVIYSTDDAAIIILFQCAGGRHGRVCIPLEEFFSRAVDARPEQQVTLN